jgi:hypothetical protein
VSFSQVNPNKSKQKSLDLFGFIWRNWDFSKGYSQKIKKSASLSTRLGVVRQTSEALISLSSPGQSSSQPVPRSGDWENNSMASVFRKQIARELRRRLRF